MAIYTQADEERIVRSGMYFHYLPLFIVRRLQILIHKYSRRRVALRYAPGHLRSLLHLARAKNG